MKEPRAGDLVYYCDGIFSKNIEMIFEDRDTFFVFITLFGKFKWRETKKYMKENLVNLTEGVWLFDNR